jgi:Domain of unknown function (DUF4189)
MRSVHSSLLLIALLSPLNAWPFGALALAVPESVHDEGIAMGMSWNMSSPQAAQREAQRQCVGFSSAPEKTRALCKVVRTFERECVAIASDPAPGGEEWGWAVAQTAQEAEQKALRSCRTGPLRFCIIAGSGCDDAEKR